MAHRVSGLPGEPRVCGHITIRFLKPRCLGIENLEPSDTTRTGKYGSTHFYPMILLLRIYLKEIIQIQKSILCTKIYSILFMTMEKL